MFSTFFSVALLVASSFQVVFADFLINSTSLVQCQTSRISWENTAHPPYNLIIVSPSNPCGEALVDLGDHNSTILNWKVALKAGSHVQLSLVDSTDQEAWSKALIVGNSPDSSCLSSPTSSTSSTSSTETPSSSTDEPATTVDPVGAANAGILHQSAAFTTRQASTPILAIALFFAAFMLQ